MQKSEMKACEIEKNILSAILIDPEHLKTVQNIGIVPDDFSDSIHRKVYDRMIHYGETDSVTMVNVFPEYGQQIAEIMTAAVTTDHFPEWCHTLMEYTTRRTTSIICQNLKDAAGNRQSGFLNEIKNAVSALIKLQQRMEVNQPKNMLEKLEDFDCLIKNPERLYVPYGFSFDQTVRHYRGEVFTLGGAPGTGKTAFAISVMRNMLEQNRRVALFCQEMSHEHLIARLVSNWSRIPVTDILENKYSQQWQAARNAIQREVEKGRLLICGMGDNRFTPSGIDAELQRFRNEYGEIDWICIDYGQVLKSDRKAENRRAELDEALEDMKIIGQKYNACLLLLAQLNRETQKNGASLNGMKETAKFEEISSILAIMTTQSSLEEQPRHIELDFLKSRNTGLCRSYFEFDGACSRFSADPHKYDVSDIPPRRQGNENSH